MDLILSASKCIQVLNSRSLNWGSRITVEIVMLRPRGMMVGSSPVWLCTAVQEFGHGCKHRKVSCEYGGRGQMVHYESRNPRGFQKATESRREAAMDTLLYSISGQTAVSDPWSSDFQPSYLSESQFLLFNYSECGSLCSLPRELAD